MKTVHALLACLWVLFGITATAHAGMAMPVSDPPCHEQAGNHKAPAAKSQQTLMPCCSQPVIIAPAGVLVPAVARVEYLNLMPAPVLKLSSLPPVHEPPPPKSV